MDPERPESTWVALGRAFGWLLLELAGFAFLASLILFQYASKGATIQGVPAIYVVAALGSLTGTGVLLVVFLKHKRT